ncbi:BTB/POZ domain-containing protein KCTD16 [Taenia crassiceps]|uniref:BTB/POZ domain-containing protein KCTD16 n=1 Tax=Taenia crassiceps TaxID=6207 RepID=A0ABR4QQ12_9CEST
MSTKVVDLNVGGWLYSTQIGTLTTVSGSKLTRWFNGSSANTLPLDSKGRAFIDRNGEIFSYILDFLRDPKSTVFPESPTTLERLRIEAEFYELPNLIAAIQEIKRTAPCTITLSYRGQIPNGRDTLADFRFRRITRILVSGKSSVCREAFGETLNESRAPDCGPEDNRYSNRYYLTHNTLEMAFDKLLEAGFTLAGCCGETSVEAGSQRSKSIGDFDGGRSQFFHEFYFIRK